MFHTSISISERMGCSRKRRRHCSEDGSRILASGPIGQLSDITICSRNGSIGGFVTCNHENFTYSSGIIPSKPAQTTAGSSWTSVDCSQIGKPMLHRCPWILAPPFCKRLACAPVHLYRLIYRSRIIGTISMPNVSLVYPNIVRRRSACMLSSSRIV